jgi:hypothetical protein
MKASSFFWCMHGLFFLFNVYDSIGLGDGYWCVRMADGSQRVSTYRFKFTLNVPCMYRYFDLDVQHGSHRLHKSEEQSSTRHSRNLVNHCASLPAAIIIVTLPTNQSSRRAQRHTQN